MSNTEELIQKWTEDYRILHKVPADQYVSKEYVIHMALTELAKKQYENPFAKKPDAAAGSSTARPSFLSRAKKFFNE